jgi:hypothetical protein
MFAVGRSTSIFFAVELSLKLAFVAGKLFSPVFVFWLFYAVSHPVNYHRLTAKFKAGNFWCF